MYSNTIALFLPSLRGGGAERVMVNLARGFVERGLKVDLVLAKAEGPYLSEVPAAVRVVNLDAARVLWALPGLIRYLRREKPVAMLSTLNYANIIALMAKRLARVPTRLVVREASNVSFSSINAYTFRGRLIPFFMRFFYPWADAVVAVSKGVAADLIQTLGISSEKIVVIYNPVINDTIFEKAEETVDHPWFCPGECPVILGVGRLTAAKDYVTLIRAFSIVRRVHMARLVILGEGEKRSELEDLVQQLGLNQYVSMPGFVDNPYAYMACAAVFVLSSAWEGFGNVIVEAMAVGTPVVSTDCPSGPAEILEGGKWGQLVPVGDIEALAAAIVTALENPVPPGLAQRAQEFGVEKAVDCYLEVLLGNKQAMKCSPETIHY